MKKIYLLLALLSFLFASCSREEKYAIWDFVNYSVAFSLDSQTNIDIDKISIDYKGKNFRAKIDAGGHTRATWARPLALRYTDFVNNKAHFTFGEFRPDNNYKNESFTINWQDGSKDVITFSVYITWKRKKPTVHFKIALNGVKQNLENGYWPTFNFKK